MKWKVMEGKKVFIEGINGRTYSGILEEVIDVGDNIIFISLYYSDKLGNQRFVSLRIQDIKIIREESF